MTRFLGALAFALFPTSLVRADVGPPLPFTKYIPGIHVIEGASEFPDHVFLIYRHGSKPGAGRPGDNDVAGVHGRNSNPGHPILLQPERYEEVVFVIVPEAAFAAHPDLKTLVSAVSENKIPGATLHRFRDRELLPSWSDNDTIWYRLQRSPSGDQVELVRASWNPMWQWYAAALFATVAVVLGGCWLIHRMRRTAPAKDSLEADS